ncbi:MAG: decaprenyl-phosphate phosphoribosyltransferase [Candidatus Eisenbacteria bacterium]|uniref:Decaprenyl-phosphate phosphoribosyltransferase n=1 Tax=Eiseniibacteriota bacterium TaxID=2212470 RepID=A0A538TBQ2_UNCEI|nr:MAG: decaprenyl-phosphate phosphoribosyltransferase [Candidatus Eisenbacteria bacterium]TMQ61058.1 MAG: decaprenyl-phosphate phosphoribosyltransferase [Candidatus Eisenbacteria bacterium]
MRVYQWTKNLILFAGVIFTLKFLDPPYVRDAVLGFLLFSLAVSGMYILNDILDVERDRHHAVKRDRPIAAGKLPVGAAAVWSAIFLAIGAGGAFLLGTRFGWTVAAYVALTLLYSIALKKVVLLDVGMIALGFVLRATAGVELIRDRAVRIGEEVVLSPWLLVCAFFLALFLAIGKRRHELALLEGDAARHRAALGAYTPRLLDQLVAVVTSATVLAYSVYTISPETLEKFGGRPLYLTIPFVLYGIFRYLYLMYAEEKGGNPSEHFYRDRPTLVNVILWGLALLAILYWPAG